MHAIAATKESRRQKAEAREEATARAMQAVRAQEGKRRKEVEVRVVAKATEALGTATATSAADDIFRGIVLILPIRMKVAEKAGRASVLPTV